MYVRRFARDAEQRARLGSCRFVVVCVVESAGLRRARTQCGATALLLLPRRFLFHFPSSCYVVVIAHAHERSTTNDATCGPPAWLTGRLHDRGIRSVRSPPRRALLMALLLATPIATPLQGGRPERPGLLFLKLRKRSCERRLNSHPVVITRPRLSLAL